MWKISQILILSVLLILLLHSAYGRSSCIENTGNSGIYDITVSRLRTFEVYCNNDIDGGGWLVILRRVDGSIDFNQNWAQYKNGFGNLRGEFFLGLEKIHTLTNSEDQELYISMESFTGVRRFAKYDLFKIGNENSRYTLEKLGSFSGDTNDSFRGHKHNMFSTKNRDNDHDRSIHYGQRYKAGWWFDRNYDVLFTGPYEPSVDIPNGLVWKNFVANKEWTRLKRVEMMIRPKYGH